jgi:hypothetical protein
VLPAGDGRTGRSHASRWADAHGFGERRSRAASFGEALQDLLPAPCGGGPERDPAIEIDLLKRNVRRAALRPPRIGELSLRRIRDGARPQEEGAPARQRRFQRPEELAAFNRAVAEGAELWTTNLGRFFKSQGVKNDLAGVDDDLAQQALDPIQDPPLLIELDRPGEPHWLSREEPC